MPPRTGRQVEKKHSAGTSIGKQMVQRHSRAAEQKEKKEDTEESKEAPDQVPPMVALLKQHSLYAPIHSAHQSAQPEIILLYLSHAASTYGCFAI